MSGSTRLCVKGLSKGTTEKDLKTHFAAKGEVTDVKIIKTTSGKSRQFAFVGFRSEVQARDAQKYFHNTFLDTARLAVEFAVKVGDTSLQSSSHSKHTQKKVDKIGRANASAKKIKEEELKEKNAEKRKAKEPDRPDATKRDFLEVMKKRTDAKFWGNDEAQAGQQTQEAVSGSKESRDLESSSEDPDSDSDDDDDDVNEVDGSSAVQIDMKSKGKAADTSKSAALSDMDYLRSKVAAVFSDDDDDDDDEEKEDEGEDDDEEDGGARRKTRANKDRKEKKERTAKMQEEEEEEEEERGPEPNPVAESDGTDNSRLFLRNLPFTCAEAELTELFSPFGPLTEVHVPIDAEKGSKGFAFVQFMIPEHAASAREQLDGSSFQGRVLHVLYSNKARERTADEDKEQGDDKNKSKSRLSSFQQKKEEERRALAGKKDGWNSTFVRSDAVVDALAEKYGIGRADILNTAEAGGEMAVRLAIGEAHVIQENRDFFSSHGVDLSALESGTSSTRGAARSTTTLLIKNLPFDLVSEELESMFGNFGAVSSFLVPPSKTVALVDFVEPTAARAAFKGLAYRRYKHTPLYLEWAPVGVIDRSKATASAKSKGKDGTKGPAVTTTAAAAAAAATASTSGTENVDDDGESFATLFIKNLAFSTTEDALRDHIMSLLSPSGSAAEAGLRTVSIPTKKSTDGSTLLSMGFGFAEFVDAARAQRATQRLQRSVLQGHALEVKSSEKRLSTARRGAGSAAAGQGNNCKLVVRNVAFQATQSELHALFSTFGSVKKVRIPKKMGGVHRGFAFVDFSTAQEARTAMASLTNTHLYGRHLVLEWAKEDEEEDLGVLRKRAGADSSAIAASKRSRRMADDEDPMAIDGAGTMGNLM